MPKIDEFVGTPFDLMMKKLKAKFIWKPQKDVFSKKNINLSKEESEEILKRMREFVANVKTRISDDPVSEIQYPRYIFIADNENNEVKSFFKKRG